jgi:hypothetical protein
VVHLRATHEATLPDRGGDHMSAEDFPHWQPLAERLVDAEIRGWLDTHLGLLKAQTSDGSAERKIVDQARHLHLDGYSTQLTPKILDALRRAGFGSCVAEEPAWTPDEAVESVRKIHAYVDYMEPEYAALARGGNDPIATGAWMILVDVQKRLPGGSCGATEAMS